LQIVEEIVKKSQSGGQDLKERMARQIQYRQLQLLAARVKANISVALL
jgi:hypothetical protein